MPDFYISLHGDTPVSKEAFTVAASKYARTPILVSGDSISFTYTTVITEGHMDALRHLHGNYVIHEEPELGD